MIKRLALTLLLAWPFAATAQRVALSFDDGFDPLAESRASGWNAAILAALSDLNVKTILFVAGERVNNPNGLALVQAWGDAGHAIANHSYSHSNFGSDRISLAEFTVDTQNNEALFRHLPGWTKRFRFPYLKEGSTVEKRDGFRRWLSDNGYASGAVTIDASDWYYNNRYLTWLEKNPNQDPTAYRTVYLAHLWDRAAYYDSLSRAVLGRSIDHVILLHTNAINALFITDIVEMFRLRGWEIISPEQAYQDPVYQSQPDVLPAGESILWALAKQHGIEGLRYPAEDGSYEKAVLDKLGL